MSPEVQREFQQAVSNKKVKWVGLAASPLGEGSALLTLETRKLP